MLRRPCARETEDGGGRLKARGSRRESAHHVRVADALAEVLIARVVCEAAELVLNRLREWRVVDVRVLRLLAGEFGIEVCDVKHRFLIIIIRVKSKQSIEITYYTGLERWLDLLCDQPDSTLADGSEYAKDNE